MALFKNIICPTSFEHIDNNTSRLAVFLNAVLMVYFLITLQPISIYIVTIDCSIRAFGYNRFSPLSLIASLLLNAFGIKHKLKDKAPKIFASRLGLICALLGSVFIFFNLPIASRVIISLFCSLAILDSVFDFCVGCLIYHNFVYPFYSKK